MTAPAPTRTDNPGAVMIQVALGCVYGWAIWAASPSMTGHVEPWDSRTDYYSMALLAAGFLSSLFWSHDFYWGPIGIYVGQVAYVWFAYHPQGVPIFPAPISVAVYGTVQSVIGALVGYTIGFAIRAAIARRKA